MRSRTPSPAVLAILLLVAGAPRPLSASVFSKADSLYAAAAARFDRGDYARARELFLKTIAFVDANDGRLTSSRLADVAARSRFLVGRSYEKTRDWRSAIATYTVSLTELPAISDAVLMRLAYCERERGDAAAAVARLREVVDAEPRTSLFLSALEELGDAYDGLGDRENALRCYTMLASESEGNDERAEALLKAGVTRRSLRDNAAAMRDLAAVVEELPSARCAGEALKRGREISRAFTDRYHQGVVLYNQQRYRDAAEFFIHYLRYDDDGRFRAEAAYFLGRSYQRMGSMGAAARRYEEAIAAPDTCEYLDLAWSKLAYARRALGNTDASLATYDEYLARYPERSGAASIAWEKARLLEEERRLREAHTAFRDVAERYPASEWAADALFRAGLCLVKLDDYRGAEASFADLYVRSSGGEAARAVFWVAKCREALGRPDEAVERYREAAAISRDSYYGRRALEKLVGVGFHSQRNVVPLGLKGAGGSAFLGSAGAMPAPTGRGSWLRDAAARIPTEALGFAAWVDGWSGAPSQRSRRDLVRDLSLIRPFVRGDTFLAVRMQSAAAREFGILERTLAHDPLMLDVLCDYYTRAGLSRRAIRTAEAVLALSPAGGLSEAPLHLAKRICPLPFRDIVASQCRGRGVDPNLFASLLRQESLFEPGAVSGAGARGLAQIMPSTGKWIARRLERDGFNERDLLKPAISIEFGVYYLALELEQVGGDVLRALAAYNAGRGNADRWWDFGGGRDTDVFVEDIGFAETADYVRRVYLYGHFYRDAYGAEW